MVRANGKVVKVPNAINMKVNILMTKSMAMVFSNGQVEILIKVNIKMMKEMATVR